MVNLFSVGGKPRLRSSPSASMYYLAFFDSLATYLVVLHEDGLFWFLSFRLLGKWSLSISVPLVCLPHWFLVFLDVGALACIVIWGHGPIWLLRDILPRFV